LGETKAEKISHIVESHLKLDLGRQPVKDAAGPDDYQHLKRVEKRAKAKFAFETRKRNGDVGWEFVPLSGFNRMFRQSEQVLADRLADIDNIIKIFLPLDTWRSEAVATLYAVWHDLLADGISPTDDQIIAGFYEWSKKKKEFAREDLAKSLAWMRKIELIPDGKGKRTATARAKLPKKRAAKGLFGPDKLQ